MRLFVQFRKAVRADMVIPTLYMRTFKQKLYKLFTQHFFTPQKIRIFHENQQNFQIILYEV